MTTAIAILATGDYWVGAQVMFHTLRKYGNLPDDVDCYAVGMEKCDFAKPLPIDKDYSWIPVSQHFFPKVADKFHALTLPHDRIILMDADMICVGDCSYLWSDAIGALGFYACRDTASVRYYQKEIDAIGLDASRLFNGGTMVFQMDVLGRTFCEEMLRRIRTGWAKAYDGGDQGYLNAVFQRECRREIGFLPPEYNESYDVNMPSLPRHAKRIIHFTGPNANPWNPHFNGSDPRWEWVNLWRQERLECGV